MVNPVVSETRRETDLTKKKSQRREKNPTSDCDEEVSSETYWEMVWTSQILEK